MLRFVVSPFVAPPRYGVLLLNVIGAAVLLSDTYAVSERKNLFYLSLTFYGDRCRS